MPQEFLTDKELQSYFKSQDEPTDLFTDDELDELTKTGVWGAIKSYPGELVKAAKELPEKLSRGAVQFLTPTMGKHRYRPTPDPERGVEGAMLMAEATDPFGTAGVEAAKKAGAGTAGQIVGGIVGSVPELLLMGGVKKAASMGLKRLGRRAITETAEDIVPKAASRAVIGDAESALPVSRGLEDIPVEDFKDVIKAVEGAPDAMPVRKVPESASLRKPDVPEPDVVTVYHGRGAAGAGAGGDWFTTNPKRAASYAGKAPEDLVEIQIPRDVFEAGQQAARKAGSGTKGDVVLSPEWAGRSKPSKVARPERYELDDSFDFSTADDMAKREAAATELGKTKPKKGFDVEKHSLSDFVALKGGLAKHIESTAEAGAYDLTKGRARVGPGNRQWFKEGGMHPDDAIQAAKEAGFYRMDAEVTVDDLIRDMDLDVKSLTGTGGSRQWSNLKQEFGISDVGTGKKSMFGSEEGSASFLRDLSNAVGRNVRPSQVKARVKKIMGTWGRSYEGAVKRMGPQGRALANRVKGFRNYSEPRISSSVARYKRAIDGLSDAEFGSTMGKERRGGNLVDVLDKGHKPTNAKVAAAALQIRELTDDVVRQARAFGWDVGELKDYFPHRLDKKLLPPDEVRPVPGSFLLAHKRAKTYNLERHREKGMKGYRRDRGVLEDYFVEAYKQLGELAYFGKRRGFAAEETVEAVKFGLMSAKDAKVMKRFHLSEEQHSEALNLIGKITNKRAHRKAFEGFLRLTGNEVETTVGHTMALMRNVNALISLSTSAIPQTTQAAHIFSEIGGRALWRGLKDVTKDYAQAKFRAELSGAVFPNFVKEYQTAHGVIAKGRFMWGLGTMDKNLRILADASGRQWVKMLEKQAAKGRRWASFNLEALGMRGGRKATEKDFHRIGRLVADTTQFRAGTPHLPVAMTHPLGQTVFQFQSFMYAHARWLTQKPLTGRTRVWKLARYVAAASVLGEMAHGTRALFLRHDLIGDEKVEMDYYNIGEALSRANQSRRIPPNHPFWRAVQDIAYVGGIGIYQSMYENLHRRGGVETILGPTVSRGGDIKRDLVDPLVQGRPDEIMYESVLRRQIPTLLKRQVWDRVFGDPEEQRRGRPMRKSERRSERR